MENCFIPILALYVLFYTTGAQDFTTYVPNLNNTHEQPACNAVQHFSAGGNSGDYGNNEFECFTFEAQPNEVAVIICDSFCTEQCCDRLWVLAGASYESLGQVAGCIGPFGFVASGRNLTVIWSSDVSRTDSGYNCSFESHVDSPALRSEYPFQLQDFPPTFPSHNYTQGNNHSYYTSTPVNDGIIDDFTSTPATTEGQEEFKISLSPKADNAKSSTKYIIIIAVLAVVILLFVVGTIVYCWFKRKNDKKIINP